MENANKIFWKICLKRHLLLLIFRSSMFEKQNYKFSRWTFGFNFFKILRPKSNIIRKKTSKYETFAKFHVKVSKKRSRNCYLGEPLMNKDYLDEYTDYIDFCHPETKEFHCSLGYYTGNESKELNVFCLDQCEISNTEKSCVLLRTSVCSGCKMDNVKNKAGWCSVKEGTCECKDGFHKGLWVAISQHPMLNQSDALFIGAM